MAGNGYVSKNNIGFTSLPGNDYSVSKCPIKSLGVFSLCLSDFKRKQCSTLNKGLQQCFTPNVLLILFSLQKCNNKITITSTQVHAPNGHLALSPIL